MKRKKKQQDYLLAKVDDEHAITQTEDECLEAVMRAAKLIKFMNSMSPEKQYEFTIEAFARTPVVIGVWPRGPAREDGKRPFDFRVLKGLALMIANARSLKGAAGLDTLAFPCAGADDADALFSDLGDGRREGALQ